MKLLKTPFLLVVTALFISACSNTQQAYLRNIQMFFESNADIVVSDEKIKNSFADLVLVKHGDSPQATMALAFVENGLHKWVSRDGVMFIFQRGRLIRSLGLKHNLLYVSNTQNDPLIAPSNYVTPVKWERIIDSEYGDYGARLNSSTTVIINQLLTIQSRLIMTKKYEEHVNYDSVKYGKHNWTNTFWVDQETEQLVKSIQKTSAQADPIEITYISRAIRLLEK